MTEYEEELMGEFKDRFTAQGVEPELAASLADDALDLIRSEGLLDGRK